MREQLLSARNLLLGTTNILLLAVPEGWRVLDGPAAPEVDRWSERENRRWMSQGQASYRLAWVAPSAPGLARAEVELRIVASPLPAGVPHAVRRRYVTLRRGLLPRREVPAAVVEVDCPLTERRLRLELVPALRREGLAAGQDDLEQLVRALLEGLRCH
ncbi:MAG: hypothetical protein AB2385_15785 [Symbiobacterium sp.]|uniref:hypothetical protein n=1 Tax=Symbiobacterium sp. TaxID=1971213 RepID=UPI0034640DD5